ncbi:MAG: class I SAM-dependent methyltransferase [Lachnospiraceae bacterium]|nr:class I SAM-dependent methyltransferase [Lachnospiraceae bacterium]
MTNLEPYKGIAGIYEEIRPSYPEELIHDIIATTNIKSDDRILEIGAGTGKATIQFANKGYQIRAIEIGEDMAEILRDKCADYSNVTIDVASFEEWKCNEDLKFDLIYSAQAFHWIDKNIKYKKCYELLIDKGYLVLFWYEPTGHKSPIKIDIDDQVNRVVKKYTRNHIINNEKSKRLEHTGVSNNDERKTELEESGLFHIIREIDYTHKIKNISSQYLKAMKSVPAFASILDGLEANIIKKMDKEIEDIINSYGGHVDEEFHYSLYLAQKN